MDRIPKRVLFLSLILTAATCDDRGKRSKKTRLHMPTQWEIFLLSLVPSHVCELWEAPQGGKTSKNPAHLKEVFLDL